MKVAFPTQLVNKVSAPATVHLLVPNIAYVLTRGCNLINNCITLRPKFLMYKHCEIFDRQLILFILAFSTLALVIQL